MDRSLFSGVLLTPQILFGEKQFHLELSWDQESRRQKIPDDKTLLPLNTSSIGKDQNSQSARDWLFKLINFYISSI